MGGVCSHNIVSLAALQEELLRRRGLQYDSSLFFFFSFRIKDILAWTSKEKEDIKGRNIHTDIKARHEKKKNRRLLEGRKEKTFLGTRTMHGIKLAVCPKCQGSFMPRCRLVVVWHSYQAFYSMKNRRKKCGTKP